MANLLSHIDPAKFSIPTLSVILGFLDGFNPCAMWALIALVSVLLLSKDRKRLLLIGGTFLLVEAVGYFLFLSAWLNIFLCLRCIKWLRVLVGILAIIVALYYLKEFLEDVKGAPVCKINFGGLKLKISQKIQDLAQISKLPAILLSVAVLAILVDFIEIWCSAGIPVIFTNALVQHNLSGFAYYFWFLVYFFFFMMIVL